MFPGALRLRPSSVPAMGSDALAVRQVADDVIDWRQGQPLASDAPMTLHALLEQVVAQHGDQPVYADEDGTCTWSDLRQQSIALAAAWSDRVQPGRRIGIVCPNGRPHLLAELAAWHLGAVAVPVFAGWGPQRIIEHLAPLAPALVVAHQPDWIDYDRLSLPAEALWSPQAVCAAAARTATTDPGPCAPDSACLIQFTSGSTGTARAVELSHRNLCSQQAAYAQLWPDFGPGDRVAGYLPWHHSFGGLAERLWVLTRGAAYTGIPGGGRDHEALIATLERVRPTVFMSVPKILRHLCEQDVFTWLRPRWVFTAGAPLGQREEDILAEHGIPVVEGWGLTETSPSACITLPDAPREPGVVGQPIPGVEVGIRRADGRIVIRGPNVMRGYAGDPAATAAMLTPDGTLDSGDIGRWQEHGLQLLGRADHMFKLANGEKVNGAEVERLLESPPCIRHALVLVVDGVLHAIVCASDETIDDQDLIDALAHSNHQQPLPFARVARAWRLLKTPAQSNALLTPSNKLARGRVRELFSALPEAFRALQ